MVFIVFEGGEGVGKTTQINLVAQKIGACVCTREPGGTPLGEEIRGLFKKHSVQQDSSQKSPILSPTTELLLVAAARHHHMEQVILPALHQRKIVLCDRFLDSTYVYQGLCGGLDKSVIDDVHQSFFKENFLPDLTIILHTKSTTAQDRIRSRHQPLDRFDAMALNKQDFSLNDGFQILYKEQWAYPQGKIPLRVLVDGEGSPEDVFARLWPLIDKTISHEI